MNLSGRFAQRSRFLEAIATLKEPAPWMHRWFGSEPTAAGIDVNERIAMTNSTVYACIRLMSELTSSVPLFVYERTSRGKDKAVDHDNYHLLHRQPNELMGSMSFRSSRQGHVEGWGNGYAFIERAKNGRPKELWPLAPDRTRGVLKDGKLTYIWRPAGGGKEVFPASELLHFAGFGFDGIRGYSPVAMARQAVALSMATERFGSALFKNGIRPSGFIEHPGKLSPDAQKNLTSSISQAHAGDGNWLKMMVLEEGMKWNTSAIAPEDAQFLQTRQFQVIEIVRFWGVQPHKIGDLSRATFSNIEQENLSLVTDVLRPRWVRNEQEYNRKLFTRSEQERFFVEHQADGLLRGDQKTRFEGYAKGRQWGWMTVNDILQLENRNTIGPEGDIRLVPLNMLNGTSLINPTDDDTPTDDDSKPGEALRKSLGAYEVRGRQTKGIAIRKGLREAHGPAFVDAAQRIVRMEDRQIRDAIKKHLGRRASTIGLSMRLDEIYKQLAIKMRGFMAPAVSALVGGIAGAAMSELGSDPSDLEIDEFVASYLEKFSDRWVISSRGQIDSILSAGGTEEELSLALENRLDEWTEKRAAKVAKKEPVKIDGAVSRLAWAVAGVAVVTWVANADACPLCDEMDGRTVSISRSFVAPGDTVDPADGDTQKLEVKQVTNHPPLHDSCICSISPE